MAVKGAVIVLMARYGIKLITVDPEHLGLKDWWNKPME